MEDSTITTFNPIQVQLLRMFQYMKSDKELLEVKQVLSSYLASKLDEEMDELWDSGQWNNEKNEALLKEHLRTPYV